MLESQLWTNKIITEMWKLKRWWYLSKLLTITITGCNFFNFPVKLQRNLKLKFRSKFNHGFTNQGYLHSAIKIKEPRRQDIFQNVQNNEIFEIFKMFKNSWINVYCTKNKRLDCLFWFLQEIAFFGKLGPKTQNYQFKLKFCT